MEEEHTKSNSSALVVMVSLCGYNTVGFLLEHTHLSSSLDFIDRLPDYVERRPELEFATL